MIYIFAYRPLPRHGLRHIHTINVTITGILTEFAYTRSSVHPDLRMAYVNAGRDALETLVVLVICRAIALPRLPYYPKAPVKGT